MAFFAKNSKKLPALGGVKEKQRCYKNN